LFPLALMALPHRANRKNVFFRTAGIDSRPLLEAVFNLGTTQLDPYLNFCFKPLVQETPSMSISSKFLAILFLIGFAPALSSAQACTHDAAFYEANHYIVNKIRMVSPLDFIFLVRHRFDLIKSGLALQEKKAFSSADFTESFKTLDKAMQADGAFGPDLPIKVVVVTDKLENCVESGSAPKVDIVYRIFSTDPLPAVTETPDERRADVRNQATAVAEKNTVPDYKIVPRLSYDHARRVSGGLNFAYRLPLGFLDSVNLAAQGSSSSSSFKAEIHGKKQPGLALLDQLDYSLNYSYGDTPGFNLELLKGVMEGRFLGVSKPLNTTAVLISFRYGAALSQGNQQSNSFALALPANTITNSSYSALKFYTGMTATTRYTEMAVSYGLQAGGTDLTNLGYTKHIGDVLYGARFPGGTHKPWDVSLRVTGGAITGNGPILINDRFFGGNSVEQFLPGDTWTIPNGPVVRSIAPNRLAGTGAGGTSFYSTGFTIGKVLFGSPIVPPEVENADGFDSGVRAAEASAENWFADDYEAASPEFKKLLTDFPAALKSDLDAATAEFAAIRSAGSVSTPLDTALKSAEREARLAQNLVKHVSDPARGSDNANKLRAWLLPTSRFRNLMAEMQKIEPLAPTAAAQLEAARNSIETHLSALEKGIADIHSGPVRAAAVKRAQQDMVRPREVIDTLRHEANSYAFSLVGIADAGRIFPDPNGTRFAIGGGGRFSLVNVNFTLGYAVNPNPHKELGQGRGALLIGFTYTNLFR
jgi:hypothetical protein